MIIDDGGHRDRSKFLWANQLFLGSFLSNEKEVIGSNNRLEPGFRGALINDWRCVSAWLPLFPVRGKRSRYRKCSFSIRRKSKAFSLRTPNTFQTDEVFVRGIIYANISSSKKLRVMDWNYYSNSFEDTNIVIFERFGNLLLERRSSVYDDSKPDVCSANRQIGMDRSSSRLTASKRAVERSAKRIIMEVELTIVGAIMDTSWIHETSWRRASVENRKKITFFFNFLIYKIRLYIRCIIKIFIDRSRQ